MASQTRILFWNCCGGATSKKQTIDSIIDKYHPELFFISEAEIKPENQKLVDLKGYKTAISETLIWGKARLMCYIAEGSSLKLRSDLLKGYNLQEILILENHDTRIIGIYRPFKLIESQTRKETTDSLFDHLQTLCQTNKRTFIGGDFNINFKRLSYETNALCEWIDNNALHKLLNELTWQRLVKNPDGTTSIRNSQIDHVFSTVSDCLVQTDDYWTSDHKLIILNVPDVPSQARKKVLTRSWKNYSAANLQEKISHHISQLTSDNDTEIHSDNPDDLNAAISKVLLDSYNQICPERVIRISKPSDIVSDEIERVKKKRKKLLAKFNKTGDQSLVQKIKDLDRKLKWKIRKVRTNIVEMKMRSGNSRSFWDTIRQLQGEHRSNETISLKLQQGSTNDPSLVSEEFASFFADKVANLSQNLGPYNWAKDNYTITITENDLTNALKCLKSKMCSGHDGIPLKIVKHGVPAMSQHVLQLMRLALRRIPIEWKRSIIRPLHKSGSKQITQNYRPIANLVSISKVFEKIVLEKINLEHPNIEGQAQHGFKKNRSTMTALLEIQHELSSALDKNLIASTYSIDMTAAFDLLRPDIFHHTANLQPSLMNILMDFMTGRTFQVQVNDGFSKDRSLNVGCVQGSILGPKLFNIYCKDILTNIPSTAKLISYADDSYVINTSDKIGKLKAITEKSMIAHASFLRSIGMKVNEAKTELMLSTRNQKINSLEITCGDVTIKNQRHMKALGIYFSDDLSWKKHIEIAIQKSNHTIRRIRFLAKWLQKSQLLQLVTSQYFPVIFYSSQVWSESLDANSWKRINSAHYRAIRAALKVYNIRLFGRQELDAMSKRATPKQWTRYSLASAVIKLYNFSDTNVANLLRDTSYVNDRMPLKARFFDRAKYKIGRQSLPNRIEHIFSNISFDWMRPISNDALRILLKSEFFAQ
jgi:hypothetical protein